MLIKSGCLVAHLKLEEDDIFAIDALVERCHPQLMRFPIMKQPVPEND